MLSLQLNGLPHSDIHGSMVICTSPQLFAAYHVLRRLREPRHPPFALAYFFFLDIINILAENVLINFSSSLLLLYNFFLIRHIYKIHAETKRLLSLWSKIVFTLCRKFSSEKVFLLFTTRYYFIFSDNIYIPHIVLFSCCNMSMTFVVAPNTSGLTPVYPYENSLSQKF